MESEVPNAAIICHKLVSDPDVHGVMSLLTAKAKEEETFRITELSLTDTCLLSPCTPELVTLHQVTSYLGDQDPASPVGMTTLEQPRETATLRQILHVHGECQENRDRGERRWQNQRNLQGDRQTHIQRLMSSPGFASASTVRPEPGRA